jgi:hypothetical protein
MSSNSKDDDDPVMRSSTERYDRVGADLDWSIILASASSIFFGFLLNIAVNPPSYLQYVLIGIICVMLAMYLGLGLALDSKLPGQIAYGLASLPFIFIFFEFFRHMHE